MTKEDYVKIAHVLNVCKPEIINNKENYAATTYADIIERLCVVFKEDNSNFDSTMFVKACIGD